MKEPLYISHLPMFTKTACGWSARISSESKNEIVGEVHVQLAKYKTHIIPMVWDKYGIPVDITTHPSKYYLRLK